MPSVPVTELKANLAKYLRMAQRGVEVQVLERGVPIARLLGLPRAVKADAAALDRLVTAGLVRRGEGSMRAIAERRLAVAANVLGALEKERGDRV